MGAQFAAETPMFSNNLQCVPEAEQSVQRLLCRAVCAITELLQGIPSRRLVCKENRAALLGETSCGPRDAVTSAKAPLHAPPRQP